MAAESALVSEATWWRQSTVYQIYPRSFADANGDGIGDLPGITSRVSYLKELGVDAVWLSPFYPSALADGGYDVDDYRNVDPRLGTLEDFDEMASALHDAGIRLIVDIVPNHSSDRHEWFREALASPPGSPARERYIFRDGKGKNGELPPSDWDSVFGGSAWERVTEADGTSGQWYLHTFAKEQPDFNWDNPEVRQDFLTTLRFWSDRGVDGFRVDVANLLVKDLPGDLPSRAELDAMDRDSGTHPLMDRDEVHEIYAEWRAVFNEYDPPRTAVAEAWVDSPVRRAKYAAPGSLGQAFNFDLLTADFDPAAFRRIVTDNLAQSASTGSSSTWVLSNHDVTRHATRYGLPPLGERKGVKQGIEWMLAGAPADGVGLELGLARARAATLFLLALPGSTYLYQGEELGLHEVGGLPAEVRQDPAYHRSVDQPEWSYDGLGRDGCRVPLPWTSSGPSFGFGPGGAHLPQPEWFGAVSVQTQEVDPGSTLDLYRDALRLRRSLLGAEALEWSDVSGGEVLGFVRPGGWLTVTNFGTAPAALPAGELLLASAPIADGILPGPATAWLRIQ
ncbi:MULTISPECIES: glycoside hydrolase family 13 protein [Arthrobacter]|uniref:Glycoside hydrolase family 13 protein n=2 Tax=Arthrobacter TaxID=1663 RepID=A0ABU9KNT6_9MICC|nr:glycoside hydrolase family 13 protein [Arthrobacter sp. YJM1]MDP5228567.1 glycoside hydrolase family 13 protein [Arthrobacter sp. YJM1]